MWPSPTVILVFLISSYSPVLCKLKMINKPLLPYPAQYPRSAPTSGFGVPVVHQVWTVIGSGLMPHVLGFGRRHRFDGHWHIVLRIAYVHLRTGRLRSHHVRCGTYQYALFLNQDLWRIIGIVLYVIVVRFHRVLYNISREKIRFRYNQQSIDQTVSCFPIKVP